MPRQYLEELLRVRKKIKNGTKVTLFSDPRYWRISEDVEKCIHRKVEHSPGRECSRYVL
jgi:hypothetical protein